MRKGHSLSVLLIAVFGMIFVPSIQAGPSGLVASASGGLHGSANNMLQFKAGGHLLGFQPGKVYFASLDHALSVEFLGTPGMMPKTAAGEGKTGKESTVPSLGRVVYEGLWEGISLTYEAREGGIAESTYRIGSWADVSKIRLRYNVPVEVQKNGSLKFKFDRGYLTESSPEAWQEIGGERVPVEVAFRVKGGEVGFSVGPYDPNYPLTIDPTYAWHSFYGSTVNDIGHAIATDGSGNVYVTGESWASWNGPAGQSPLHAYNGGGVEDIFVLKLDSSGAYQWHTFYGSTANDIGHAIATDGSGNVYVTGESWASWNGPAGQSPLRAYSGGGVEDIFVLKLDSSGAYQWHTFYGSTANDIGHAIATDGSGNVYVTGESWASWNGPAGQSPLRAYSGGGVEDIFVLKLASSGAYQWHTFYGSTANDIGHAIATDGSGNVYVTGESWASWNGPAGQSPLRAYSGGGVEDIFVLKLASSGAYQWHTFYGSTANDIGHAIATDGSGNVYVTGESWASWNGPAGQSPLRAYSGGGVEDIFVLKLASSGAYQWHTFYGSTANDIGHAIATDGSGNVYVTGESWASWNGPAGQSPLRAYSGGGVEDIFVLKLASSGAYQWHTFYGSTANDIGHAIATDGSGNVYVTGESWASWNGDAGQSPLHAYSGGGVEDIFVLKLVEPDLIETAVSDPPSSSTAGASFSVTDTVKNQGSASAGASITSYYLSLDTTKGSGDILLTGSRSVPSLGINETNGGILTVTIPSGTGSGSYYLLACADNTNMVEESDDNNNCLASMSKVSVVSIISVTSPNGGETLTAGSAQTIRWTYGGNPGSNVKIELLKGGVVTTTLNYSTSIGSAGSGSYNWSIPSNQVSGSNYQIRVTSTTSAVYTDTSDSVFTIVGPPPPTISVTSPNGGESLTAGSTQTVRWSYSGNPGSNVKIELLKGGVVTTTLNYSTSIGSAGSGSYNWSIPSNQVSGSDYQIKVTSTTNSAYSDISDSVFTIVGPPPPTISVTSPNGGETLTAGSAQTIRWTYGGNPGSNVKIELLKGGVVNRALTSFNSVGSGGSGSYNWSIPSNQVSGSDYQIKVTSTTNSAYSDISDSVFTIVGPPPPTISVTSPNGGETLTAGSAQTIQWGYGGNPGSNVKIELLKGGVVTTTLSYSTSIGSAGSGSYNWSIPSNQVSGSDYQIRVTSTTSAVYTDTSDSVFTIVGPPPPTISVTSPNGGETLTAGSAQTIRWSYGGNPGSNVKIELLKGGVVTTTLNYSTSIGSAGSGSYNWSIPSNQVSGSNYQIKVTSTTNSAYSDISDSVFTIVGPPPPTISVTSPNGGESLTAGSAQTIQWGYGGNPGSNVKIELLKGGVVTTTLNYFTSIGSAGSGSYNWSIPSNQVSGSDYQIKVTSTNNGSYTDTSDSVFTIVGPPPPTISVTSPNGGETLTAGSAQTIQWTYGGNPGSNVKIELLKGGIVNRTLTSFNSVGSGGSGSYNWSIPSNQVSGSDYQIKVTSTTNSAYTDTSDSNFTIGN